VRDSESPGLFQLGRNDCRLGDMTMQGHEAVAIAKMGEVGRLCSSCTVNEASILQAIDFTCWEVAESLEGGGLLKSKSRSFQVVDSTRRRGGRVSESAGLLILPARFVYTDFHVFCSC